MRHIHRLGSIQFHFHKRAIHACQVKKNRNYTGGTPKLYESNCCQELVCVSGTRVVQVSIPASHRVVQLVLFILGTPNTPRGLLVVIQVSC